MNQKELFEIKKKYDDTSLTAEEKVLLYDAQYALWHRLRPDGRHKHHINAIVVWGFGVCTGEFDDNYNVVGLGKQLVCVELTLFLTDGSVLGATQCVDRKDFGKKAQPTVDKMFNNLIHN